MPSRVRCLAAVVLLVGACSSASTAPNRDAGGGGASGAGGDGDAGGGGGSAGGATALACYQGIGTNAFFVVGFANPDDFSNNPETGARDQHTLRIDAEDVFDGIVTYVTGGSADHAHLVGFTLQQIKGIQSNGGSPIAAVDTDPPVGRPDGHHHTVNVTTCGIPGD